MSMRRVIAVLVLGSCIFWSSALWAQAFSREELDSAIVKSVRFLVNQQKANGEIRDSVNPLFNTWETILAAEALLEANDGKLTPAVLAALDYLKANESPEGWMCHNAKCHQLYCVETTASYFSLLIKAGRSLNSAGNVSLVRLQQADGSWQVGNPDVRENKNYPSVTAFMLDMMQQNALKDSACTKGLCFLETSQNKEGHWGASWEYYNCPAYALWKAVPVLRKGERYEALKKSLNYIYSNQQRNGSWYYTDSPLAKQPSAVLQTALIVSGLKYETSPEAETAIKKAIAFLIEMQKPDGSWDGGFFPVQNVRYVKKEYIFATTRVLLVLLNYKRTIN